MQVTPWQYLCETSKRKPAKGPAFFLLGWRLLNYLPEALLCNRFWIQRFQDAPKVAPTCCSLQLCTVHPKAEAGGYPRTLLATTSPTHLGMSVPGQRLGVHQFRG